MQQKYRNIKPSIGWKIPCKLPIPRTKCFIVYVLFTLKTWLKYSIFSIKLYPVSKFPYSSIKDFLKTVRSQIFLSISIDRKLPEFMSSLNQTLKNMFFLYLSIKKFPKLRILRKKRIIAIKISYSSMEYFRQPRSSRTKCFLRSEFRVFLKPRFLDVLLLL